jgi:hypothetical protein
MEEEFVCLALGRGPTDTNKPGLEGRPSTFGKTLNEKTCVPSEGVNRFSCLAPGLDWTRLFMSLTAGAGTRCMSLLPQSPTLWLDRKRKKTPSAHASSFGGVSVSGGCYMTPRDRDPALKAATKRPSSHVSVSKVKKPTPRDEARLKARLGSTGDVLSCVFFPQQAVISRRLTKCSLGGRHMKGKEHRCAEPNLALKASHLPPTHDVGGQPKVGWKMVVKVSNSHSPGHWMSLVFASLRFFSSNVLAGCYLHDTRD